MKKLGTSGRAEKKLDADYLEVLTSAEHIFSTGNRYTEAISDYRKALSLNPGKYPTEKIAEAEKQLAALAALQQQYEDLILAGDKKKGNLKRL